MQQNHTQKPFYTVFYYIIMMAIYECYIGERLAAMVEAENPVDAINHAKGLHVERVTDSSEWTAKKRKIGCM